jgi:hypothetical protein
MNFRTVPPKNITNLFWNWLHGVQKIVKIQLRVGVCSLLWEMWHVRNDIIFKKLKHASFLQFIPLATNCTRTWLCLQWRRHAKTWILGATIWKWLLRVYYAGAADSLIIGSHVETLLFCLGFRVYSAGANFVWSMNCNKDTLSLNF